MQKIKTWPVLFIVGIWLLFSIPYFLKEKVPYPSSYQVNHFAPWSHYDRFWGPVKNGAMPDIIDQIYPWKHFTIETWKKGQIPFWNPYSFSGNPHLANYQSAVFSPFNLLFFILPFVDAWSLMILVQPLLAAFFIYLLMRNYKISKIGSLISSVSFMFCGFIVVWMAYGTLGFSILFLPLSIFAIEKYWTGKAKKFLFLFVLTIPFSFFSGHFQISLYFLIAIFLYILFKFYATINLQNTFKSLLALFLGIILSLPQILPAVELYQNAVRSKLFLFSEAIPFVYLITLVAPDFFGNPVTRNDWFGHYAEWAGFVGFLPLFLALFAILKRKNDYIWFFFLTGITALFLSINNPLSQFIIGLRIPVLSTSSLSRVIVIFSMSFAVLSGFGFDSLMGDLKKKNLKPFIMLGVFFLFLTAFIWLVVLFGNIIPKEWVIVVRRNFILPTVILCLGFLVILISSLHRKLFFPVISCLLLLISFDSLRFAQKWMPFDPKGLVFQKVEVIEGIKNNIGYGRIFGNLGAQVDTYYEFPSIEGYDPLYVSRYGEFIRSAFNGELLEAERSVVKIDRNGKYTDRVLDLLGVSLIFHPIADTDQGWAYPVWKDKQRFSLVFQDNKFQLFRNNTALKRVILFYDFEVIKDKSSIIKRFYKEDFNFRKKLILEEDPNIKKSRSKGESEIIYYLPNKILIKVKSEEPGLLFLSDNFYPGWSVTINGKEGKILRADYSFRAVVVPAGESNVEFLYNPFIF